MITLRGKISVQRLRGMVNITAAEGGGGPLQEKRVYPTHDRQVVASDEEFYGLSVVTIEPVPRKPFADVSIFAGSSPTPAQAVIDMNLGVGVSAKAFNQVACEYEVLPVDGATYGFKLNSAGYYESQNKGVASSYAMCKIVFSATEPGFVVLNCINYAENNYDFGLISEPNIMLAMSSDVDSSGVLHSFKGKSSASVQKVFVILPSGENFVCVKFRKDGGSDTGNDSLQFSISV